MYLWLGPGGGGGADYPICRACHQPIAPGTLDRVQFQPGTAFELERLNGNYHRDCAAGLLEIGRRLDRIGRLSF